MVIFSYIKDLKAILNPWNQKKSDLHAWVHQLFFQIKVTKIKLLIGQLKNQKIFGPWCQLDVTTREKMFI